MWSVGTRQVLGLSLGWTVAVSSSVDRLMWTLDFGRLPIHNGPSLFIPRRLKYFGFIESIGYFTCSLLYRSSNVTDFLFIDYLSVYDSTTAAKILNCIQIFEICLRLYKNIWDFLTYISSFSRFRYVNIQMFKISLRMYRYIWDFLMYISCLLRYYSSINLNWNSIITFRYNMLYKRRSYINSLAVIQEFNKILIVGFIQTYNICRDQRIPAEIIFPIVLLPSGCLR